MNNFALTYIIDDDAIFVLVLKKILCKLNIFNEIINIRNGQEALNILSNNYYNFEPLPDLIYLDINMPVLNGWQFLEELEKLPFADQLNIYIISSTIDLEEIEKAKQFVSVKNFISKPIKKEDIIKLFLDP